MEIPNIYINKAKEDTEKLKTYDSFIEYVSNLLYLNELKDREINFKEQIIKDITNYVENEMPYLQEPDEEFERCDGTTYMTMKEYDKNILLNFLNKKINESAKSSELFSLRGSANSIRKRLGLPIIEKDNIKEILSLNTDYYAEEVYYENLSKEEICLDIQTLKHKINEIIKIENKGDNK